MLVHNGYGRHFEYLSLYQKSRLLQWTQAVEFANYIGLFFVRISIGFLLLRLLANTNHWTRWAVHFVLVVNTCAIIMVVVPYAIICIPFKAYYDKSVHGKCINPEVIRQVTRTYGGEYRALEPASPEWLTNCRHRLLHGFHMCYTTNTDPEATSNEPWEETCSSLHARLRLLDSRLQHWPNNHSGRANRGSILWEFFQILQELL